MIFRQITVDNTHKKTWKIVKKAQRFVATFISVLFYYIYNRKGPSDMK